MLGKDDAKRLARALLKKYPLAAPTLDFSSPLELLIATILAAQCTDERVNQVTEKLFKKYRTAADYADASLPQLEREIKTTGFFRQKAKAIKACSQSLVEQFGGEVPDSMDALTQLRGIGRKTANMVLGDALGQPAIIVDTHVRRLSRRMGLTGKKDPDKIEFDLREIVPKAKWTPFSHAMMAHGRSICVARKPRCSICPVRKLCPYDGPSD